MSKIVPANSLRRLLRPLLIASVGTVMAGVSVWSVAGLVATANSSAFGAGHLLPGPRTSAPQQGEARVPVAYVSTDKGPRHIIAGARPVVAASLTGAHGKSARHLEVAAQSGASVNAARFDAVAKRAGLTSGKLAGLFGTHGNEDPREPAATVAEARFASPADVADRSQIMLAYADPSPGGPVDTALSGLLASQGEAGLAAQQDTVDDNVDAAAEGPVFEITPSDGPLPDIRPRDEQAREQGEAATEPQVTEPRTNGQPVAGEPAKPKPQAVAYARPNDPADDSAGKSNGGSLSQALRNMFGGGQRAGNGVAVYDISAAKVYMPDGSVLEAHSGVGKMADDPRYVNVKMTGPTPPHTYNLQMREKRFHGVEAIRMLPVDGKNKYGRDGFLTHSYLLRGGRAESHGCVAFKDYERFLTAFKKGKVRQLVVVPSGGRSGTRLASNG